MKLSKTFSALFCGIFLIPLFSSSLAQALDLSLHDENGRAQAELYLPMRAFLVNLPLGFRVCSPRQVRSVRFEPDVEGNPAALREGNCLAVNYVEFFEDTRVIAELGDGTEASAVISVRNGVADPGFKLLRTDHTRFVSMRLSANNRSAVVCSNRSATLRQVEGRLLDSGDAFQPLAVVGRANGSCTSISELQNMAVPEAWEFFFEFSDGERIRYVD